MGLLDVLFGMDDDRLRMIYDKAVIDANGDVSKAERSAEVDQALCMYVDQHNCSYDEALILAATGKRTGKLAK